MIHLKVYGSWVDIVVDDFLPVGANNELIFCKNRNQKNEFWCSLLEKVIHFLIIVFSTAIK